MKVEEKDKSTQFIVKLLKETLDKKITWSIYPQYDKIKLSDDEQLKGEVFHAYINKRYIRIFKYETFYLEYSYVNLQEKVKRNIVKYRLELFNVDSGLCLWVFPEASALSDLYNAVALKVSKAEEFINSFLES